MSLAQITGFPYHRHKELCDFMERMKLHYARLKADTDGYSLIVNKRYNDCLFRRGEWHRYTDSQGTFEACLTRTEPDGRLLLQDREGNLRRYWFKEVGYML